MFRRIGILFATLFFLGFNIQITFAQTPSTSQNQTFYKVKVIQIIQQGQKNIGGIKNFYQDLRIEFLDGPQKGKTTIFENGGNITLTQAQRVNEGDTVVLSTTTDSNGRSQYIIYDRYRLPSLESIIIFLALVVILIARWKGFGSLLGLSISLGIIVAYIIPTILSGADPVMTCIYGSLMILLVTTYLAHGISKQTTVALVSTFAALFLTLLFSSVFASLAHLSGFSEQTSNLQFGPTSNLNLSGLLLGGVIIGTLGALNDITTTQSTAIFELLKTDKSQSFGHIYKKGFAIGKEHIVSMINTLVLAYAGSSLALFFFFALNPQKLPFWVIINSEDISEEIVRSVAGSMGLILIVPIVTALATLVAIQFKEEK